MPLLHLSSLAEITAAEWDALLPDDQPFLRHAFLLALEESGSVRAENGWQPDHLLWREDGRGEVAGTVPAVGLGAGLHQSPEGRSPAGDPGVCRWRRHPGKPEAVAGCRLYWCRSGERFIPRGAIR